MTNYRQIGILRKNSRLRTDYLTRYYVVPLLLFILSFSLGATWKDMKHAQQTLILEDMAIFTNQDQEDSLESTDLALTESLGFFTDIPDSVWRRHQKRFSLTQPNYINRNRKRLERLGRYSNFFWAENFEPEFTCAHEFRLGKLGDGGKWVCDPHRIITETKDKCLVYSIGSNGNFDFEVETKKHVSPTCEIHTFDLKKQSRSKNFFEEAEKVEVDFHHWGIGERGDSQEHMKTFKEIMTALNHGGETIDLMKIDCEKCEYRQFREWLEDWKEMKVLVRQVMIEIHNSDMPTIVEIFTEFQNAGYVIFHKEANYMNGGHCVEMAFLLLDKKFQHHFHN